MREVVNVHIGQGGNQIGTAFWNLLLLEHEKTPDTDPALSSFFYFSPSKSSGKSRYEMKARALLVDMECGPLQEVMKGSLGGLFDEAQYIMDVSGAGNNFAQGYSYYGNQYHDRFLEGIRKNTEKCESLQAFFLTHSLGGGTGSGVGTYILSLLYDEYRKVTRFSTCIYPTDENDVITSPYNTLLATRELIEHADCVFPLNNSALFKFFQLENPTKANSGVENPEVTQGVAKSKKRSRGFDEVNLIAARMLCHVTSSCRFHGEMNVDLNEIYTNLVPFPRLHFLMTALNIRQPALPSNQRQDYSRTALQRAFGEITSNKGQLSGAFQYSASNPPIPQSSSSTISVTTNYNPHGKPMTIASAFLARGKVTLSEFIQCVTHSQRQVLQFPEWNPEACKVILNLFKVMFNFHITNYHLNIRLVCVIRRHLGKK